MAKFSHDLGAKLGTDESDVSDVNSSEMARMVEGLEDLDAGLFGTANKMKDKQITVAPSNKKPEQESVQGVLRSSQRKEQKSGTLSSKLPGFEDFDDSDDGSDPLADLDDLLSDSMKTKKPTTGFIGSGVRDSKKSEEKAPEMTNLNTDTNNKAKLFADLFGSDTSIDKGSSNKNVMKSETDGAGNMGDARKSDHLGQSSVKRVNFAPDSVDMSTQPKNQPIASLVGVSQPKEQTSPLLGNRNESIDLEDDLLPGIGLEKFGKSSTAAGKLSDKKSSIMDELLGRNVGQSANKIEKKPSERNDDTVKETEMSFGSYSPSIAPASTQPRRSAVRRNTSSIGDPLGILSPVSTPKKIVGSPVHNRTEERGSASWLGLSSELPSSHSPPLHQTTSYTDNVSADNAGEKNLPANSSVTTASQEIHSSSVLPLRRQQQHAMSKAPSGQLPEWLGGAPSVQEKPEILNISTSGSTHTIPAAEQQQPAGILQAQQPSEGAPETPTPIPLTSNIDSAVAASLFRQEASLSIALQLRQHEEKTAHLVQRQTTLLQQQEQQLQFLIAQQIERQKKLDDALVDQQKRITLYLEALSAQPLIPESLPQPSFIPPREEKKYPETKEEVLIQPDTLRWEQEKKSLEEIIESLKNRHVQELQLLEDSYKRQLSTLQKSLETQEEYFQKETLKHQQHFELRLAHLQEFITELKRTHDTELTAIKQKYEQDIEATRNQHTAALEHVQVFRNAELAALGEIRSYSSVLNIALEKMGQNAQDIQIIGEKLSGESIALQDAKTAALKAKEKELQATRDILEKQQKAAEAEQKRLLGLISQLEQQLSQQKVDSDDARMALQQERAHLEARELAVLREREQASAHFERERQHLQHLKQSLAEERQQHLQQIKEEHLKLAAEKSHIETLARLNRTREMDREKMVVEIDAAMATVRAAREEAEIERAKVQEEKHKLEAEWLRLRALEEDLVGRSHQLESLSQAAAVIREEGLQALEEARQLGDQHSKQFSDIQQQLTSLRKQEKQLSEEKRSLAEERLKLRQTYAPKFCSKCKMSVEAASVDHSLSSLQDNVVDPKVIMMKLIAEKDDVPAEERHTVLSALPSFQSADKYH
ncbi:fas-binding factor 1 [Schistocerca cancellata]|uniref:fas-binding factor 1 n=1 Tax=Schistocerca cancellata TaxID=274614 RepID=UPI002118C361|nr:fas-binding factor 1 [Schistocerca cancellata]XP_049778546.1 fas-binding factor 1 [Schistocerca cancellata]XP_049778547.1 fas-binding factor 1 [Schistocerca cancellata]XP_049778548.1 fas-binding factor 1 [Schistocerca cancellata]XP_049778549.1 fas-binding factor 1 [Schistocerca cancellata]XP_049778550.1 fas-binding factor 1 [Schistocerca cancellata]